MREHGRQSRGMEQEWAAYQQRVCQEDCRRALQAERVAEATEAGLGGSIERLYKQNEHQQERDRGRGPERDYRVSGRWCDFAR